MKDTKVHSDSVSVVIPLPAVDPNLYDSIDKEYLERTWDEILSDEASFNSSFDEYPRNKAMDGTLGRRRDAPDAKHARKDPGHARSPYFTSQKPSKKRTVSKREIIQVDSDSDDEKSVEEHANASNHLDSATSERVSFDAKQKDVEDWQNDLTLDEMEADAFAVLNADDHSRLVYFIAEQPFFKSNAYPVKRSERREFVHAVRQAAIDIGVNQGTIEKILAYVKKLYLTASGWGHACRSGSEYGDEIDDESAKITKSARNKKKDRKRKRNLSDKSRDLPAKKTTDSSNVAQCQALKSTDAEIDIRSERTKKFIWDSSSSKAQIPGPVAGSLSNISETVWLDSSDSDHSALPTPTKRRINVKEKENQRSPQALSLPDRLKSARSPEVVAWAGSMLKELSSQHADTSRLNPGSPDEPTALKGPSSKTTKRRRQRRESRNTGSASDSFDNPRYWPINTPKDSQTVSTAAPKKSEPALAVTTICDDSDSVDLDF